MTTSATNAGDEGLHIQRGAVQLPEVAPGLMSPVITAINLSHAFNP